MVSQTLFIRVWFRICKEEVCFGKYRWILLCLEQFVCSLRFVYDFA